MRRITRGPTTGRICAVCNKPISPTGRKDTYGFGTMLRKVGITHREKAHPDCIQVLLLKHKQISKPIMKPLDGEEER